MARALAFEAIKTLRNGAGFNHMEVAQIDELLDRLGVPKDTGNGAPEPIDAHPVPLPAFGPVALITPALLKAAVPGRPLNELAEWVRPIQQACAKYEINTVRRVAAFIAQMAHESELKPRSENLNYSVKGLLKTFGRHRISRMAAMRLGRAPGRKAQQRSIANAIYGGAWGEKNLGNTRPTDGWDMRGVGPLQVTGRGNLTRFARSVGKPLGEAIRYARETIEGGVMSAGWFWEANDVNRLADTPGVADETKRINGGANGLADRKKRFDRLVNALLKAGG